MIPRGRLEALTDGVFGFAMTLLVINLTLPDDFHPSSPADLLHALRGLDGALIAYVVSFLVLSVRWLSLVSVREVPDEASGAYAWAVLTHLFFITVTPFSTMLVGRFPDQWPAIWVYAANMILSALASIRISILAERETGRRPAHTGRVDLAVLIASALLSAAISRINPSWAMYAYFLNFAGPIVSRVTGRG